MGTKKSIFIIILAFMLLLLSTNYTYVYSISGETIDGAEGFVQKGEQAESPIDEQQTKVMTDLLYNLVLIIGTACAMIVGVYLGIQFVTGSVEQKSKIKETLIPFIAGCVVMFGAFGIWKIVIEVLRTTQ